MIDIYEDNGLANLVMAAILILTAAAVVALVRRWSWKNFILAALSGVVVPFIVSAVVIAASLLTDRPGAVLFQIKSVILVLGMPAAMAGFAAAPAVRLIRSQAS